MSNSKTRSNLIKYFKVLFGVGLLSLVLIWAGPRKLLHGIMQADRWHLTVAVGFILCSHLLGIKRWQLLSQSLNIKERFHHFVVLHFTGLFSNNFLPTGIGGDLVKAHYLSQAGHEHKAYLSVMLDRYVGLLVLLIVAAIVAFYQPRDEFHLKLSYVTWAILFLLLCGGFAMLVFTNLIVSLLVRYNFPRLVGKVREFNELMRDFLGNYPIVGGTLLLSAVSQGFGILAVYQLSLAAGAQVGVGSMFIIVPLVLMVNVLPISFGGLGTREAVFIYLLSNAYIGNGMDAATANSTATLVALLWLAVNLFVSLPGAAGYSMISRLRTEDVEAEIALDDKDRDTGKNDKDAKVEALEV